jgi:hypothetical protein
MMKKKLEKYKKNLSYDDKYCYSYNTLVAEIIPNNRYILHGYWSPTTTKHVNYWAKCLNLTKHAQ